MKLPPVPGAAMITCTLSESLSAIVFWISSGWRDKLSDKVQVIIAAPGSDGGFIGAGLLGSQKRSALGRAGAVEQHVAADDAKEAP